MWSGLAEKENSKIIVRKVVAVREKKEVNIEIGR